MATFISSHQLSLLFILLLISHVSRVSLARSTIKAMGKDQIACTMCSACDNPCQPIFSPPPPPVSCPPPPVPSPPPPSAPPPSGPYCPPPPSAPPPSGPYCPPPPPSEESSYVPPPSGDDYYPPPATIQPFPTPPPPPATIQPFPTPPPPPATIQPFPTPPLNQIVPYFPDSDMLSNSIQSRNHKLVSCLILCLSLLCLM